jgi:hypothetical protein
MTARLDRTHWWCPMSASVVGAISQSILSIAAIAAGLWAAYTFSRAKRQNATRWSVEFFDRFFRDPDLVEARKIFEHEYWKRSISDLCALRVTARRVDLADPQQELLHQLDLVLNFLENLLFLEEEGQLMRKDRDVLFRSSFAILKYPSRATLRRYLARVSYNRCARYAYGVGSFPEAAEFFVYPTEKLTLDGVSLVGQISIPLHVDAGLFTFLSAPEIYFIYEVRTEKAWIELDALHGFDASDPGAGLGRRICIADPYQARDVWVYVTHPAARKVPGMFPVSGGSFWL